MPVPYKGAWRMMVPDSSGDQLLSMHMGCIARLRTTLRFHFERAQMQLLGRGALAMNDSYVSFKDMASRDKALKVAMLENCHPETFRRFEDLAGLVAVADERAASVINGIWVSSVNNDGALILVDAASLRGWCSSSIAARSSRSGVFEIGVEQGIRIGAEPAGEVLAMSYAETELEEIKAAMRLLICEMSAFASEVEQAREFVLRVGRSPSLQRKSG